MSNTGILQMIEQIKCSVLNSNEEQCQNKIYTYIGYHGDSEIYSYHYDHDDYDMRWVRVGICKKHFRENCKHD